MELPGEGALAFADLAFAEKTARGDPLIDQQFKGIVEFFFMLFHKREAASTDNFRHPFFGDVEATELDDSPDRALQVPDHIFVEKEEESRIMPTFPISSHMIEPGSPGYPSSHKKPEKLLKTAPISEVRPVELKE